MQNQNQQNLLENEHGVVQNSLFSQRAKETVTQSLRSRINYLQRELETLTARRVPNDGAASSSCGLIGAIVSYGVAEHNYLAFITTSGCGQCGLAWIPFCLLGSAIDGLIQCCQHSKINRDIDRTTEQLQTLIAELRELESSEQQREDARPPAYIGNA